MYEKSPKSPQSHPEKVMSTLSPEPSLEEHVERIILWKHFLLKLMPLPSGYPSWDDPSDSDDARNGNEGTRA